MAMATWAASNPRALLPGANLPRVRFVVPALRTRVVLDFAFSVATGHKISRFRVAGGNYESITCHVIDPRIAACHRLPTN